MSPIDIDFNLEMLFQENASWRRQVRIGIRPIRGDGATRNGWIAGTSFQDRQGSNLVIRKNRCETKTIGADRSIDFSHSSGCMK